MSDQESLAPITTLDFDLEKEADRTVPSATYTAEIEGIKEEFVESKEGNPVAQWSVRMRILDEEVFDEATGVNVEVLGKTLFDNIRLAKNMAWKIQPFIKAAGITTSDQDGKTVVNYQEALNRVVKVVVTRDKIERDGVLTDENRNNIKRYVKADQEAA